MPNRMKLLRERACLTQEQLAERTGYSQAAIQRIETDKRGTAFAKIEKLAKALGVHPGELFQEQPSCSDVDQAEAQLLKVFRSMQEDHKKALVLVAEVLAPSATSIGPDRGRRAHR